jgi:glycyl-tRNA synthetase alpha subunit
LENNFEHLKFDYSEVKSSGQDNLLGGYNNISVQSKKTYQKKIQGVSKHCTFKSYGDCKYDKQKA